MKKCETGEVQRLHCDKMDEMDEEMRTTNEECFDSKTKKKKTVDTMQCNAKHCLKGKGYEGKQGRGEDSIYLMPMAMCHYVVTLLSTLWG